MERIGEQKQQQQQQQQPQQRPRVLGVLAWLLDRAVARNERAGMSSRLTVFHGLRAPSIGIERYLERIFKYASCSPSCFVVAYAYMDRFMRLQPDVPITSLNVHRLVITSVMVAAKFLDDAYYNNAYYAKVGGVTTQEMNRLELEFLFRLHFRLHVTVSVFEAYCTHLERQVTCSGAAAALCPVQRTPPLLLPLCCSSSSLSDQQRQLEQQQQQQQQQQYQLQQQADHQRNPFTRYSYASVV